MGVETFLTVAFWMYGIALFTRCGFLTCKEYPRLETYSVGSDVFLLLWQIFFFVWVCYLKFGVEMAGAIGG